MLQLVRTHLKPLYCSFFRREDRDTPTKYCECAATRSSIPDRFRRSMLSTPVPSRKLLFSFKRQQTNNANWIRFRRESWRPISNLSFLSKLVERVAVFRLNEHLGRYNLLPPRQSAYRAHHSTETAVTAVVNEIAQSVDGGQLCAPVLLDLSSAFDTIDHQIFLDTTEKRFCVDGIALGWFQSYLDQRTQVFHVGVGTSASMRIKYTEYRRGPSSVQSGSSVIQRTSKRFYLVFR